MRTKNEPSLAKQGTILAVAAVLVRFIGFFYRIPLANMLGDEGIGNYSAAFKIYSLFLIISSYGVPIAISKMISERYTSKDYYNAHKIFKTTLMVTITISIICGLILWFGYDVLAGAVGYPRSNYAIRALAPTIVIVGIMSSFRGYFQGMNTMKPTAVSQIVEQVFNAVFSLVMAWALISQGVAYGAMGGTLGTGIGAFSGLIILILVYLLATRGINNRIKKQGEIKKVENSVDIIKELTITVMPILVGIAIMNIMNILDSKMLSAGLTQLNYPREEIDRLNGMLDNKFTLITTLPIAIATALASASVPSLAKSIVQQQFGMVKKKINTMLKFTMLVALPSAIGLLILAEPIIRLLFPEDSRGVGLLQVGAVSVIFYCILQITTGLLQGIDKVMVPAKNALYGAIIKIILNFIFIYLLNMNVYGPVLSTNLFAIIVSILNLRSVIKYANVKINYVVAFVKPTISSVIMGLYSFLFFRLLNWGTGNSNVSCLITIVISIIIYFIVLINIKGLTDEELGMLPFGGKIKAVINRFK